MGWTVWGSNPVSAKFSAPVQTGPGSQPASCAIGAECFPCAKNGRGVTLTTHHFLAPCTWKSRAIPYSSYWPYGLHSSSVPVKDGLFMFYVDSHSDVRTFTAGRQVQLVGNDVVDNCGWWSGVRWSIFVDELRSATFLNISAFLSCLLVLLPS